MARGVPTPISVRMSRPKLNAPVWTSSRLRMLACPRRCVRRMSPVSYRCAFGRSRCSLRRRSKRRCCTNRHWPARGPPTGSSPADVIGHWPAEGGHPIEDLTAEDGLTPLPSWTPGAKTISDDGLVAKERVLHPALTMVP